MTTASLELPFNEQPANTSQQCYGSAYNPNGFTRAEASVLPVLPYAVAVRGAHMPADAVHGRVGGVKPSAHCCTRLAGTPHASICSYSTMLSYLSFKTSSQGPLASVIPYAMALKSNALGQRWTDQRSALLVQVVRMPDVQQKFLAPASWGELVRERVEDHMVGHSESKHGPAHVLKACSK